MNRRLRVACLPFLLLLVVLALGCRTPGGGRSGGSSSQPTQTPPAVQEQVGDGPVKVYGANVYSPGQAIYKELRQQDSLMAFLACQGEPDRLEVVQHPGAPKIVLEYRRRGVLQTGTVEIEPGPYGFYTARPINPQGRLPSSAQAPSRPSRPKPPSRPSHESRPAPPREAPPREPDPPEIVEPPVIEEPADPPSIPLPNDEQLDDCPIEPWRQDCQDLCGPNASWEWCGYEG
ncbi:MAG: hypothetical protein AAF430_20105 [Myxococcota bacterium]